jgi:hypothetical protein
MIKLTKKNCECFSGVHAMCSLLDKKSNKDHLRFLHFDKENLVGTDGARLVSVPMSEVSLHVEIIASTSWLEPVKANKTEIWLTPAFCEGGYPEYDLALAKPTTVLDTIASDPCKHWIEYYTRILRAMNPNNTFNPDYFKWACDAMGHHSGTITLAGEGRPLVFKTDFCTAVIMPRKYSDD